MERNAQRIFFASSQNVSHGVQTTGPFTGNLKRPLSRRNYTVQIHHITDALIACGYYCLDEQAKALGVSRSTAWTIVKTKHKLGRLSTKTTTRILANPETPPAVRAVVQQYLTERCNHFGTLANKD